jgi:alpha-mannosidase
MTGLSIHLVSHTHWDREWYLTFQQFRLKLVHLIDGLLETLDSNPDYRHFMLDGQTIVLDDYLAIRPGREQTLRRLIGSGRLLIGPWHILPDEFLVSPEATIRNLLQGERTARKFGVKMHLGYIPDPFGHIGQMPQILRGFGIQAAAFRRGLSDEPCELWWEAPDGSRVLTAYLRDGYDNAAALPVADKERFVSEVRRLRDGLLPHTASTHILLMQGTDHMEPVPDTPAAIAFARGKLDGDTLIHSTLPDYLDAVRPALGDRPLPVVTGELRSPKRHQLLPGVLSTRMWIKQCNRACETLLEKWVEPFTTFAAYSREEEKNDPRLHRAAPVVRQAWRLLMENHPHDSICGCSIDQVHDEMRVRFDQVQQIGEELTRQSLEALAGRVDSKISPDQRTSDSAILVFNPTGAARSDVLSASLKLEAAVGEFDLLDADGARIPYQTRGLGSREIINMLLSPGELQASFGEINDGRAAGMAVRDLHIHREDDRVFIEAVMNEGGEPNLPVWNEGVKQVRGYLDDDSVTSYSVRVRSSAATRLVFTAEDVPGLGYKTYWVRAKPGRNQPVRLNLLARALIPLGSRLARSTAGQRLLGRLRRDTSGKPPYKIENEYFVVEAGRDGSLDLLDKRTRAAFRGLNRFVDGGDCGDEYNYAPPAEDLPAAARLKRVHLHRGPVQQTLELELAMKVPAALSLDRKSRARQTACLPITVQATLTAGVPRLDVHTSVDNRAKDHRLRVHFPAPFAVARGTHDGHFEVVQRPVGVPAFDAAWVEQPRPEVPQRAFSDISDGTLGLMLANRGLPEVEILNKPDSHAEIALTLLRCVGWLSRDDFSTRKGHAGPNKETPGAQLPGKWEFDYSVIPHAGVWQTACLQGYAFEAPLRGVVTGFHAGSLPASNAFIRSEPQAFVISAVKEAESDDSEKTTRVGVLVRGYNLGGEQIAVTIKPWRKFARAELVSMSEEKIGDLIPLPDGSVSFPARGHQVVSVMFRE